MEILYKRIYVMLSNSMILFAVLTAFLLFPNAVLAQDADEDSGEVLEEVVVTGSRIKRMELITSTPMTVLGAQDYVLAGTTNIEQLLNSLPEVLPGEGGFTNNDSSGVATIDLRGLGVQRSMVLVNGRRYIFYNSQQVTDLNTIPVGLIAGTEIITGGSSAVYGSDAIAGVVNFLLKDNFEGLSMSAQYDFSRHGDGEVTNVDFLVGSNFADSKGNAVIYASFLDRNAVLADARSQSVFFLVDSTDENGNPVLRPGGSSSIPNGRISGFPTSGVEFDARPALQQALIDAGLMGVGSNGFKFDDTGDEVSLMVRPRDEYNFNPLNYLQLPQERKTFGAIGHYNISDTFEVYSEAVFVQNIVETKRAPTPTGGSVLLQIDSPFFPPSVQNIFATLDSLEGTIQRDANGLPVLGGDGLPIIIPAATRNDGYTTVRVARRLAEVATRDVTFERNAVRAVFGFRGDLGDIGFINNASVDAYYSYARTRNVRNSFGSVLGDAFRQGLTTIFDADGNLVCLNNTNGCVPINMFGPFITQDAIDFFSTSATSSEVAEMQVVTAVVTGDLFSLSAGPVGFAAGVERRDVEGLFVPSQGGIGDTNQGPTGGGYHVLEFFGEVLVPITDTLELSAAGRYSDYSLNNIGGVSTYGAGITWRAIPGIMLRGQYQRAVRAPSIDELFSAQGGSGPASVDPCALPSAATDPVIRDLCIANGVPIASVGDPGLQPNFQIRGVTGGNPALHEESTDTYTVGLVLTPESLPGLNVTIDYFNITVDDAIAQSGGTVTNVMDLCFNQIQNIDSVFCQAVHRQPDGIIGASADTPDGGVFVLNENIGKLETDGIDVHVNYSWDVGFGLFNANSSFDLSFGWTWLNSFDVTPVAELPELINICAGSFGLTCGEPLPEFKATTRLTWNSGPLTSSLRWRWIGDVTDDKITSGALTKAELAVPTTGDVSYVDLTLRYMFNESYSMSFGIENMFDITQPIIGSSQEQLNTFPSSYDPFGQNFFLSFTSSF